MLKIFQARLQQYVNFHRLDGHGFGWTPGVGDGQGGLACCDSWGCKESGHDWVTELNWTPWKESYDQPIQHIKKQRHYFVNKGPSSQGYGFSSGHVRMWVGLERKLRSEELMLLKCGVGEDFKRPLDCKEIQPVHPKGDQSWVFFGGTDAKAETPILWPPHAMSWLIGKDSDTRRDWG